MFNLENLSKRIMSFLLKDEEVDKVSKAKMEYGLSIILGISIEFILSLLVSSIFRTTLYTAVLMISALSLRLFTGGAHCTSFNRCLIFTIICFVSVSIMVKFIYLNIEAQSIFILCIFLFLTVLLPFLLKINMHGLFVFLLNGLILFFGIVIAGENFLPGILLSISFGLTIQAFLLMYSGTVIIKKLDEVMKNLGV